MKTPIEIWNELKNVLGDEDWQWWNEKKNAMQVECRLLGIDEWDTHIDQGELEQHHEWYLDNCEDDEIPLNHEEYLREIEPEVINMILGQRWRAYENMSSSRIVVVFEGIDFWNRAVFKSIKTKDRFGSLGKLVDTEDKARARITEQDLVYLGNRFGCEPMGTSPQGIIKIVWEKQHD